MELSQTYIEEMFFKYAGSPKRLTNGNLNGKCFHCKEGKSWNTKSRLYYIQEKNYLFCHNCQQIWSPLKWIKDVTNDNILSIINTSKTYSQSIGEITGENQIKKYNNQYLPHEAINLFDTNQVQYYKDNKVVQHALKYIHQRRLDTALNRVNLFISLTDYIHKNRLIIPFYNRNNKVDFYQSRKLFDTNSPKYLSKMDSDKSIFGLTKVDPLFDYLFIFEGPIDSMFIKNGISMGGLTASTLQQSLLEPYIFFERIWVLDNQYDNKDVYNKYIDLLEKREKIFIWPKELKDYKDLNEYCEKVGTDSINPEIIINNSTNNIIDKIKLVI